MSAYTNMTDGELQSLAYGMTGGASRSADAAAELRRRERRDAAIDRDVNPALAALRYHVSGAVERGEAEPITEQP